MTADDIWGESYINISGSALYLSNINSFEWMLYICYRENDGPTFMRKGAQRRIGLRINPLVDLEEVKEAFQNYKLSKHGLDEETSKKVFSKLEDMIKNGEKDSEIED